MNHSVKRLSLILCVLLLIPLLCFTVGAEGEASYKGTKTAELLDYANSYETKISDLTSDVGTQTYDLLFDEYVSPLGRLPATATNAEVDLYYNKGVAVAPLAWIYYSHPELHPAEGETNAVLEEYLKQKAIIDGKKLGDSDLDAFFTGSSDKAAVVEDCYTYLLQTVYLEKISRLAQESESIPDSEVPALLEAAKSSIRALRYRDDYSERNDGTFKVLFDNTVDSVAKQRLREEAVAELTAVFEFLYPNESYGTTVNARIVTFKTLVPTANDVSTINLYLQNAIWGMLDDLKAEDTCGSFAKVYLDTLKTLVEQSTLKAIQDGVITSFDFSAYPTDRHRADAKDDLTDYFKSLTDKPDYLQANKDFLDAIRKEYVNADGYLDLAKTIEAIDLASARARLRANWYNYYLTDTVASIKGFVGENATLLGQAADLYLLTDESIKDGSKDIDAQMSSFDGALLPEKAEMRDLVADAEAEAFTQKHSAILIKDPNDVTKADKEALNVAIAEATSPNLSDAAKEKLQNVFRTLGDLYKAALRDELSSHVTDDYAKSLRENAASALNNKLTALSLYDKQLKVDLATLKAEADKLIDKSSAIKSVLDRYNEILSEEAYPSYLTKYQSAMKGVCDDAIVQIVGAEATPDKTLIDRLNELEGNAILTLNKNEALAQIKLATNNSSESGIQTILTDAEQKILAAQNTADINQHKSDALLSISKFFVAEDLTAEVENAKNAIGALENLSDAEKTVYIEQANAKLETLKANLATAKTQGEIDTLKTNFEISLEDTLTKAAETDLKNAHASAKTEAGSKLTDAFNALKSDKDSYSAENWQTLENLYNSCLDEINNHKDLDKLEELLQLANQMIASLQAINKDRLYTDDQIVADPDKSPAPPSDYNPIENGYAGAIESEDGIPSDADLTIKAADYADALKKIREAAKRNRVYTPNGVPVSDDLARLLKNCELTAALDITLGDVTVSSDHKYTVSVLMPGNTDMSNIIGIVYLHEDGSAEFYEVTSREFLLSFSTSHFSNYYVVSEKVVNLLPVIFILCGILLCEIVVLVLLYLRRARNRGEREVLASFALPVALLTKYRPAGGLLGVCLLSVAVLALGGWITYLILTDRKEEEPDEENFEEETDEDAFEDAEETEEATEIEEPEEIDVMEEDLPTEEELLEEETEAQEDLPVEEAESVEEACLEETEEERLPVAVGAADEAEPSDEEEGVDWDPSDWLGENAPEEEAAPEEETALTVLEKAEDTEEKLPADFEGAVPMALEEILEIEEESAEDTEEEAPLLDAPEEAPLLDAPEELPALEAPEEVIEEVIEEEEEEEEEEGTPIYEGSFTEITEEESLESEEELLDQNEDFETAEALEEMEELDDFQDDPFEEEAPEEVEVSDEEDLSEEETEDDVPWEEESDEEAEEFEEELAEESEESEEVPEEEPEEIEIPGELIPEADDADTAEDAAEETIEEIEEVVAEEAIPSVETEETTEKEAVEETEKDIEEEAAEEAEEAFPEEAEEEKTFEADEAAILLGALKTMLEEEPEDRADISDDLFSFTDSHEPLPIVTVSVADALIPDDIAKKHQVTEEEPTEIYSGTKKAEINIDTISQNFEKGDRVSLNTLKEKKLIQKNVGFVKVLARGTLNKPLTVVAQDFSVAALKMILLTGGTPIKAEPSPERGGRKA